MDEYFRMCNCLEIQGQWEPKRGDKALCLIGEPHYEVIVDDPIWYGERKQYYRWLPRQKDIQERLLEATGVPWEWLLLAEAMVMWFLNQHHKEFFSDEPGSPYALMTMDQLWICYYMSEAHKKQWTEKGWA